MKSHKDLDLWKKGMVFVTDVYRHTEKFPQSEIYGLTSQLRRAAVSIVSNLAEGAARQSNKEFIQFLYCALGSASEVETQLEIAGRLGYLSDERLRVLIDQRDEIGRMLFGLIRKVKK